MRISIIIPTLNEASHIKHTLRALHPEHVEILVADGGSSDETVSIASRYATVISTKKGRAAQMNAGAAKATGDVLLFLHADTVLADTWFDELRDALKDAKIIGGGFHVRFDNRTLIYRLMNGYSNCRATYTGMFHGDQAIFLRKKIFDEIGGYPNIPLMEDVVISRRMRKAGKTVLLNTTATTSARRIEKTGVIKSILRYLFFKTTFFFGASPEYLARLYRKSD